MHNRPDCRLPLQNALPHFKVLHYARTVTVPLCVHCGTLNCVHCKTAKRRLLSAHLKTHTARHLLGNVRNQKKTSAARGTQGTAHREKCTAQVPICSVEVLCSALCVEICTVRKQTSIARSTNTLHHTLFATHGVGCISFQMHIILYKHDLKAYLETNSLR